MLASAIRSPKEYPNANSSQTICKASQTLINKVFLSVHLVAKVCTILHLQLAAPLSEDLYQIETIPSIYFPQCPFAWCLDIGAS